MTVAAALLSLMASTSTRLRYVLCPFNPFVGSSEQNVCQGK